MLGCLAPAWLLAYVQVMTEARQYRCNGECQQHFQPVSNILVLNSETRCGNTVNCKQY